MVMIGTTAQKSTIKTMMTMEWLPVGSTTSNLIRSMVMTEWLTPMVMDTLTSVSTNGTPTQETLYPILARVNCATPSRIDGFRENA